MTAHATSNGRPVVLAVDDDAGVREAVRVVLEECYEVVTADSGLGGLAVLASRPVDVVLLDIRMPGLDGLQTLARMKLAHPYVEVIIVSALDEVPGVVRSIKLGAFDYVTKPWDEEDLIAIIDRAIDSHRGGRPAVLLIGSDAAALASLQVVLAQHVTTVLAMPFADVLARIGEQRFRLAVFDTPDSPAEMAECLRILGPHLPECPVVLLTASPARARVLPEVSALTTSVRIVGKPYRFEDVRGVVATVVADDESWPPLGPHASRAIEHVSQHYRESLTVGEIARAAGVSADHLARVFRESVGIGIKEYLRRVQVAVASRLLTDSNRKLDEVAELAGFRDASHLSRVFIGETGTRPGEYRRRGRPAAR